MKAQNIAKIGSTGIPFVEQGKNVLRFNTGQGIVMYFPESNKWQHHGRNHMGDADTFIAWIKRLGPRPV